MCQHWRAVGFRQPAPMQIVERERSGRAIVSPRARTEAQAVGVHLHCALIVSYSLSMGSLLQIRNVPDEARRVLKARAAGRGESLNAYLLTLLDREVARPTVAEVLDRAARRSERAEAGAVDVLDEARSQRDEQLQQRHTT